MKESEVEQGNLVRTEKGMVTNETSLNKCLDLFFMSGSARHWEESKIINLFKEALEEDELTAMKIIFRNRDIRAGSGERRFFRVCSMYLRENHPELLIKNLKNIPHFGRYDDLTHLLSKDKNNDEIDNKILLYIKETLEGDE